ncbi:Phospho-2-dehydro-3-deoxyheptonate aldolase [Venturia nashicola]|nr:Phospho-2-dehydro-3-deoxyheptonate aldolase [Venturia nashicola]
MNINEPAPTAALALPFTKAANPHAEYSHSELRMPFAHRIPDGIRNHFIAMCGEFVGTVLFLYFALSGAQVANSVNSSAGLSVQETGSNPQQLQYIALCFGFSLAVNAWVFFRISGGLFNPAVTIGMCLIGALPWVRGCLLFIVQLLGGIAASALVSCMFPGPLNVQTSLGGNTTVVQGLFIEMMLTAQLVFTIFMLAAEKHKGTFIAPVGIGLSLFVAELTGVFFTGGSLNPARSLGPAVVNRHFNHYHWIYWVGPILGAVLAAGFYKFIKVLEYETANPAQDTDGSNNRFQTAESMMEQGGRRGSKEWQQTHVSNGSNTTSATFATHVPNGNGAYADENGGYVAANNGVASGLAEKPPMMRRGTTQPGNVRRESQRLESPAMGTVDDAFHGLSGGMHGDEAPRRIIS